MRPYRKTAYIHGVERNVVNYYIPFQVERLDSLLRARLSQYDFQIAFLPEGDTLSRFNSWKILPEHLFPPCLGVKYRYAPVGAERGDDRSRFPDKPSSEADGGTTDFESVSDPVAAFLLGFAN